jgi:hypothetical protein
LDEDFFFDFESAPPGFDQGSLAAQTRVPFGFLSPDEADVDLLPVFGAGSVAGVYLTEVLIALKI